METLPSSVVTLLITIPARYVFSQERRDWAWWESLRNYVYMNGNSW